MIHALLLSLATLLLSNRTRAVPALEPESATFIELRAGPYYPDIDAELAGESAPFRDTFGAERRLMLGFGYDRQLVALGQAAGLWLGVAAAYTRFGADALLGDGSGKRAEEDTHLAVLPLLRIGSTTWTVALALEL